MDLSCPRSKCRQAGWQADFLEDAGLGELSQEKYVRVGQDVRPIGETISKGLSEKRRLN